MSEETRQHIIRTGADIIHRNGFNNTGIMEILKASGVPKGSFYYYFESKEAFGVEVARYFADHFAEQVAHIMNDAGIAPVDRLKMFFGYFKKYFESEGWSRGCPIGNLAQEMGDLSEKLQAELAMIFERMGRSLAAVIAEGQQQGQIAEDLDPYDTAVFIISAWHGAIVQMKVRKSSQPLDIFEKSIFESFLQK